MEEVKDKREECEEKELTHVIHGVAELPLSYGMEEKEDLIFLDPTVGEGKRVVADKETSIPQLFAVLRQLLHPVCSNMNLIVSRLLNRGVNINDFDLVTGFSLLHYAVRGAALNEKHSVAVVKQLLCRGADPSVRCMYNDMNSLHLCAYFDTPGIAQLLLKPCSKWPRVEVDGVCESFEWGTPLHIAAAALSCRVVEVLLQYGASCDVKDELGRTPLECLPSLSNISEDELPKVETIRKLLTTRSEVQPSLDAKKMELGSRVTFSSLNHLEHPGNKDLHPGNFNKEHQGTLRYVGPIPSASGQWAGIELDRPDGKNNGTLAGQAYFHCRRNHGIFVPAYKVKAAECQNNIIKNAPERKPKRNTVKLEVGDKVLVSGQMEGTVRFIGRTQFASGTWCGVELHDKGAGRNDGSIAGIRYFTCAPTCGIFAPPSKLRKMKEEGGRRADDEKHQLDCSSEDEKDDRDVIPDEDVITRHDTGKDRLEPEVGENARLKPDMVVDLNGTSKTAVVRFVGRTEFASGVWVGLELATPEGRNDGSVKGRRYFKCAANRGLMLRPGRVSYRGVPGDQLVTDL